MGKGKGGGTKTKVAKLSGGNRKKVRIRNQIRRLNMKIARWKRYAEEIKEEKRKGSLKRWNTSGLEKHKALLETFI